MLVIHVLDWLYLQVIIEMVDQFYAVFDFTPQFDQVFSCIQPLLNSLPTSLTGSKRPSALLVLLHTVASYEATICFVSDRPAVVRTLILCVGCVGKAEPEVVRKVMDVLNALLDRDEGSSIMPHAEVCSILL